MVSVWAYGVAIIDVLEHKSRDQFSRGRFRPTTENFLLADDSSFPETGTPSGLCSRLWRGHSYQSRHCNPTCFLGLGDHDDIVRSYFDHSAQTPRTGFGSVCIVGRRVATTSSNQLLFDCFEDAEFTDKGRVDITAHWSTGGRVITRDCQVIIRSRRPDVNPVDSVGLGLRCILCHRWGHDDVVRFLR